MKKTWVFICLFFLVFIVSCMRYEPFNETKNSNYINTGDQGYYNGYIFNRDNNLAVENQYEDAILNLENCLMLKYFNNEIDFINENFESVKRVYLNKYIDNITAAQKNGDNIVLCGNLQKTLKILFLSINGEIIKEYSLLNSRAFEGYLFSILDFIIYDNSIFILEDNKGKDNQKLIKAIIKDNNLIPIKIVDLERKDINNFLLNNGKIYIPCKMGSFIILNTDLEVLKKVDYGSAKLYKSIVYNDSLLTCGYYLKNNTAYPYLLSSDMEGNKLKEKVFEGSVTMYSTEISNSKSDVAVNNKNIYLLCDKKYKLKYGCDNLKPVVLKIDENFGLEKIYNPFNEVSEPNRGLGKKLFFYNERLNITGSFVYNTGINDVIYPFHIIYN